MDKVKMVFGIDTQHRRMANVSLFLGCVARGVSEYQVVEFKVALDLFSGPMDLLLYLVKKHRRRICGVYRCDARHGHRSDWRVCRVGKRASGN